MYSYVFNCNGEYLIGPRTWESTETLYYRLENLHEPASNIYFLANTGINEQQRYKITIPENVTLSIIAKRQ